MACDDRRRRRTLTEAPGSGSSRPTRRSRCFAPKRTASSATPRASSSSRRPSTRCSATRGSNLIAPPGEGKPRSTPPPRPTSLAWATAGTWIFPATRCNADCTYAEDFAALVRAGEAPPITYAHIRRDPEAEQLYVQYWFYYYFNQFNDLHESDWEGMQIAFDAATPASGARGGPVGDRPLPARGRRAGRLGRREGREAWHAPGRLLGRRLARDLLRLGRLHRERPAWLGRRLRQHEPSRFARSPRGRSWCRPTRRPGARFEWLDIRGSLGSTRVRLQQRPAGPERRSSNGSIRSKTQESLRRDEPGAARQRDRRADDHHRVLRRRSPRSRAHQPRGRHAAGAIGLLVGLALLVIVPLALTRWRPVELSPLRQPRALRPARAGGPSALRPPLARPCCRSGSARSRWSLALDVVYLGLREIVDAAIDDVLGIGSVRFSLEGSLLSTAGIGAAIASGAVVVFARELERGTVLGSDRDLPRAPAGVLADVRRAVARLAPLPAAGAHARRPADRDLEVRRVAIRPAGRPVRGPRRARRAARRARAWCAATGSTRSGSRAFCG